MRALLLYPRFPSTFWSFEAVLKLVGRKALVPPLGLITVAAILPQEWEFRLLDCNLREPQDDDWDWCDIVILSAMNVQQRDFGARITECRRRGKPVAVGGPFPTSVPAFAEAAGADFLVLDEGELTIPPFVEHLAREGLSGPRPLDQPALRFSAGGEKPDITKTPIPRFDLLDLSAYDTMAIQYSRGCPFLCEFCDIIKLYGRRPRTKQPGQILAELETLYELGWRRGVFIVDDNFIGNKRQAKELLRQIAAWQLRKGYPFSLQTEASIDLAADGELLQLMREALFDSVFIGIETPDRESLALTRKHQNNRHPLAESVQTIGDHGIRVMAGFIIGFDGEEPGAGERIVRFVEDTGIPAPIIAMLQALPNTALWDRLTAEGRLLPDMGTVNQDQLINFVPTRPIAEIAREYIDAIDTLSDPCHYLDRSYRYFLKLAPPHRPPDAPRPRDPRTWGMKLRAAVDDIMVLRAFLILIWRQGIRRPSRWKFWHHLVDMLRKNPTVALHYLAVCAHNEHFLAYRAQVRRSIEAQLAAAPTGVYRPQPEPARSVRPVRNSRAQDRVAP